MKQIKRSLIKLYRDSYELRETILLFISLFVILPILLAGIIGAIFNAG